MTADYFSENTGGVGTSTEYGPSTKYVPMAHAEHVVEGSVELTCVCGHINFVGMNYCETCGESLD